MMTLRHDGILHRWQNLPIGCDPCANQLRALCQSVVVLAPISCEPCANQLWSLRQSVASLVPISCGPCANQLRSLRYRLMESSLRPALTTTTRDKQPSASMISNHRQGLHFVVKPCPRDRVATVVESSGVK